MIALGSIDKLNSQPEAALSYFRNQNLKPERWPSYQSTKGFIKHHRNVISISFIGASLNHQLAVAAIFKSNDSTHYFCRIASPRIQAMLIKHSHDLERVLIDIPVANEAVNSQAHKNLE